jgi:hypothetical protein
MKYLMGPAGTNRCFRVRVQVVDPEIRKRLPAPYTGKAALVESTYQTDEKQAEIVALPIISKFLGMVASATVGACASKQVSALLDTPPFAEWTRASVAARALAELVRDDKQLAAMAAIVNEHFRQQEAEVEAEIWATIRAHLLKTGGRRQRRFVGDGDAAPVVKQEVER